MGSLLPPCKRTLGSYRGVALSPDGQMVATGGDDGLLRLWDARRGTCLRTLQADRHYQRVDSTGMTRVTHAERMALLALGAVEQQGPGGGPSTTRPQELAL